MSVLDHLDDVTFRLTPWVLVALGFAFVAGLALSRWLAPRLGCRPVVALAAVVSTAAVLVVTRPVWWMYGLSFAHETFDLTRGLTWWTQGWDRVPEVLQSGEGRSNVLLFVPAGVAWAAAVRRPGRVLLGLAALSFLVETAQGVVGQRAADPRDLVANVLGAAAGVGLVSAWRMVDRLGWRGLVARSHSAAHLRAAGALAVFAMAVVAGGFQLVQTRADAAEANLLAAAQAAYGDTTPQLVDLIRHDSATDAFGRFISRTGIRADYLLPLDGGPAVQARFTADTTLVQRCVVVTWFPDHTSVRAGDRWECRQPSAVTSVASAP